MKIFGFVIALTFIIAGVITTILSFANPELAGHWRLPGPIVFIAGIALLIDSRLEKNWRKRNGRNN